jgi:hypothetical protein
LLNTEWGSGLVPFVPNPKRGNEQTAPQPPAIKHFRTFHAKRFQGVLRMRSAATAILILILTGCTTMPVPNAAADYGAPPTNYVVAVHAYFDSTMKDPTSVQYRDISQPTKGYVAHGGGVLASKYVTYGWDVKATINAKNSYGGYVGFKTYTFLFRGDKIADKLSPDD